MYSGSCQRDMERETYFVLDYMECWILHNKKNHTHKEREVGTKLKN